MNNDASDTPLGQSPKCGASVLVLTRDEQVNIVACLESLRFCDDVVVLDSCSSDRTVELTQEFANARIISRSFDNEYNQRTYGLHEVTYKYPWVYICDADERVTPELAEEITRVTQLPENPHTAYRLRYKNMFMDRWLRFGGTYPIWLVRLVRPEQVAYEVRETNLHPVVDGSIGDLQEQFIHYSFNKGVRPWLKKHNLYSELESLEATKVIKGSVLNHLQHVASGDYATRRRGIKNLSFYLPGRALVRLVYMYLIRAGIFDGVAGFHYTAMISMYEYWIEVKIRERQGDWMNRSRALAERLLAEGNHAGD